MHDDVTTIQLKIKTYEKLSALKRKMSSKMDKDLTFDQLILEMIANTNI